MSQIAPQNESTSPVVVPPVSKSLVQPQPRGLVKPGLYTTEFWTMIVAVLVAVLSQHGWVGVIPKGSASFVEEVSVAAYAISRGLAKAGK